MIEAAIMGAFTVEDISENNMSKSRYIHDVK
jgi:hypothetical protein